MMVIWLGKPEKPVTNDTLQADVHGDGHQPREHQSLIAKTF